MIHIVMFLFIYFVTFDCYQILRDKVIDQNTFKLS